MTKTYPYTRDDIRAAYEAVGVATGKTVLVRSDLARLYAFETPGRQAVLDAHYEILRELIGSNGTLVVPSGNLEICNTETPFDADQTPSAMLGVFSEYIRTLPGARRRFHPYISHAAIGPLAGDIVDDCSRHAYGPETPKARLIDMDALAVSVGIHPRLTCSTVHHAEQAVGVPYRYTKEFMHPVVRDGALAEEPFYMFVTHHGVDIERDKNKKIWAEFEARYEAPYAPLGKGGVWSYSMADFYASTIASFKEDIYVWLARPPENRPYRT